MDFKPPNSEIGWILIALLGGIAKFFDLYFKGERGMNTGKFISLLFISGFAGWLTASMMYLYEPKWVTAAAGVGGFTGTKIFEIVIDAVSVKLGIKEPKKPEGEDDGLGE